jgi:hypothetical protein
MDQMGRERIQAERLSSEDAVNDRGPESSGVSLTFCFLRRILLKTFKYRLYPTPEQETLRTQQREECRWLHNPFREHRKNAREGDGVGLSDNEQTMTLPGLKKERP